MVPKGVVLRGVQTVYGACFWHTPLDFYKVFNGARRRGSRRRFPENLRVSLDVFKVILIEPGSQHFQDVELYALKCTGVKFDLG